MGDDAAAALQERLAGLAAEVRRTDAMVGAGEPDGVHDLRVALRRTRSLLRTFRPVLHEGDADDAARLVVETRWAGGRLGEVRDAEVVHERLSDLVAEQPAELVLGGVTARLADEARAAARTGRALVEAQRADPRHLRLLGDLEAFAARTPFEAATDDDLRARLRKDWRRVRRRAAAADGLPAGEAAWTAALHETRKAAKRARYAAETVAPALGKPAERMAEVAEQGQDALGAHRDTLLTRQLLRRLGVQAHLDGDNGFTFGLLHGLERARGVAALGDYARVRPELDRKRHRRWLS